MPTISGPLKLVTDKPALVTEVLVRSEDLRPYGGGLVTDFNDAVPVTNGQVSFNCLPGVAVMVLIQAGIPQTPVPIIVQESPAQQSLADVVRAAQLVEGKDADKLAQIVKQITSTLTGSEKVAAKVAQDARNAESSANTARTHADRAQTARTGAETAQTGARNAESSARTQAGNAANSAKAAAASAGEAKTSETNAATHATKAAGHEVAAQTEANRSRDEANRAATIAGSTKWEGTRLRVNNQLSPDLKGPKGDKGDRGTDGTVSFDRLTEAQREQIRGLPGAIASPTDPGRNDVIWLNTAGEPTWAAIANTVTVETDEQAQALAGRIPKGWVVWALDTDTKYREV